MIVNDLATWECYSLLLVVAYLFAIIAKILLIYRQVWKSKSVLKIKKNDP